MTEPELLNSSLITILIALSNLAGPLPFTPKQHNVPDPKPSSSKSRKKWHRTKEKENSLLKSPYSIQLVTPTQGVKRSGLNQIELNVPVEKGTQCKRHKGMHLRSDTLMKEVEEASLE